MAYIEMICPGCGGIVSFDHDQLRIMPQPIMVMCPCGHRWHYKGIQAS